MVGGRCCGIDGMKLKFSFVLLFGFKEEILLGVGELGVTFEYVPAQNLFNGFVSHSDKFHHLAVLFLER